MKHARTDYDAIQPWPQVRPHHARRKGVVVMNMTDESGGNPTITPIIPEDEPVFLLRARDRFAPTLVHDWALMLERAARKELAPDGDLGSYKAGAPEWAAHDAAMETAARIHAWAEEMARYAQEHGSKIPDVPEGSLR